MNPPISNLKLFLDSPEDESVEVLRSTINSSVALASVDSEDISSNPPISTLKLYLPKFQTLKERCRWLHHRS